MGGKYSAEWWEKIAVIKRAIPTRQEPSSIIDHLIQATASGRPPPAKDVKRCKLRAAASKKESSLAG